MGSSPAPAPEPNVTELLRLAGAGDQVAQEQLCVTVYEELRRIARHAMQGERPNHTLQPTALVHEAFVKLVKDPIPWNNRAHFFAVAANTMRRVLIDHARALGAKKRHGGVQVDLEHVHLFTPERVPELIALDEAMTRFEALYPRACRVVELQFFAGFAPKEVASMLGVNVKTVQRDWKMGKAWLHAELADREPNNPRLV